MLVFIYFLYTYKMESMKISELKAEVKRLGLRRYSRLRKAELIDLLLRNQNPILDESVPEIDFPILKPTEYKPPPAVTA